MRYRLLPQAQRELDEIWLYIARESTSIDTADAQVDVVTDTFWLISRHPRIGRTWEQGLRLGLRRIPAGEYVVVYRIEDHEILILHIIHGSRDIDRLVVG